MFLNLGACAVCSMRIGFHIPTHSLLPLLFCFVDVQEMASGF